MIYLTFTRYLLTPDESNNCNITPTDRRNIYYFPEATSGEYTLVANTDGCQFGDELILFLKRDVELLRINFPSDKFVLTYCGNLTEFLTLKEQQENIGEVSASNFMLNFYFDGTKFLSTFDTG